MAYSTETLITKFNICNDLRSLQLDREFFRDSSIAKIEDSLKGAITLWKSKKVRGLWARVYAQDSHLIPIFLAVGFDFHHALGTVEPGHSLNPSNRRTVPPIALSCTCPEPINRKHSHNPNITANGLVASLDNSEDNALASLSPANSTSSPPTAPARTPPPDTPCELHAHSYVMLTRWLAAAEPFNLPHFATNHVGCAGFVVVEAERFGEQPDPSGSRDRVLCVQERYAERPIWKFPGGLSDRGELLAEGARREVFEETGVAARPLGLLALRQKRRFHFDCADVYFVCLMRPDPVPASAPTGEPVSSDANAHANHNAHSERQATPLPPPPEIHFDRGEIGDCRWMPVNEFERSPDITDFNRIVVAAYRNFKSTGQILSLQSLTGDSIVMRINSDKLDGLPIVRE